MKTILRLWTIKIVLGYTSCIFMLLNPSDAILKVLTINTLSTIGRVCVSVKKEEQAKQFSNHNGDWGGC